jgi:hypothetical protein
MPDSFYQQHLLDDETLRVLQLILMNPDSLTAEITDRTWGILSSALHINEADLKTQVLGNASWAPESTMSVGAFPIELFVTRKHGHYLLKDPSPGSENVSGIFLGVPEGKKVQWDGRYQLGVDDAGKDVVYYHVSWTYKGEPYWGWIPNKYLAPEVKHWDYRIPSNGEGTYGYGDGKDAWWKYYIGTGAAQNLDLSKLMKELGIDDYDLYAKPHFNLCGWLATMEALGIPLEEGFRILASLYPDHLKNSQAQANASELTQFINEFSDNGWSAESKYTMGEIELSLIQDHKTIVLVALDGNNHFSTCKNDAKSGHWIRIRSINGEEVTYYDSLSNNEKTVTRKEFEVAWESAQYVPGNSSASANLFVEASFE